MTNVDRKIQRALVDQWNAVRNCIVRLNNSAAVEPQNAETLFRVTHSDADTVSVDIGQTLLIFPERANHTQTAMHIVVTGQLAFDKKHFEAHAQLRTTRFTSAAGYFRLKKNGDLQHVFGAHYDLTEDEVGHPAFHAQMKSFFEFRDMVQARYGSVTLQASDEMKYVLRTVRLPSAQMDYFSLLVQTVADHLMSPNYSSDEDVSTFRELLTKNKEIQGRAYDIARLQLPTAISCYRSVHWYP